MLIETSQWIIPDLFTQWYFSLKDSAYQGKVKQIQVIQIQDCAFQNFFYEMGTFVRTSDSLLQNINIIIEGSQFTRINLCGAIFSNNRQYNLSHLTPNTFWHIDTQGIVEYLKFLDYSRSIYQQRYFKNPTSESLSFTSIMMHGNTFTQLDFLHNPESDGTYNRIISRIGKVPFKQMQHIGLILDIDDQSNNTQVEISANSFSEIKPTYRKPTDVENTDDHCTYIDSDQWPDQFAIYKELSTYYQFTHLFSLRHLYNSQILIADNTFKNMSLTSSILFIEGSLNQRKQYIALFRNEFTLLHAYMKNIIVDIRRSFSTLNENGELMNKDNFTDVQLMQYIEYGGGILIQENTFTDIVGCPSVEASISQVAVLDLSGLFSGWAMGDQQLVYDRIPIGTSLVMNMANRYRLESLFEKDYSKVAVNIEYQQEQITLNKQVCHYKGNSYLDVSMGAQIEPGPFDYKYRGAAHKFYNVMAVDFRHENYTNIMAFTVEHLSFVMTQIANVNSSTTLKPNMLYTVPDALYDWSWYQSDWYYKCLSNTLIYGKEMARLRILDRNVFDSVALIDGFDSSFYDPNDEQSTNFGLILKLTNFKGRVQIGGPDDISKETSQDYKDNERTIITNIQGMLNQRTVNKFPQWNYTQWPYPQTDFIENDHFFLTQISSMVNLINTDNEFSEIRFQNMLVDKLDMLYSGTTTSIMLELQDGELMYQKTDSYVVKDFEFFDATYYNYGNPIFFMNGYNYTLDGIKIHDIGRFFAFEDQQKWGYSLRIDTLSTQSLFYIYLNNVMDFSTNTSIINSKLYVNNCLFDNILSDDQFAYIFQVKLGDYNRDQDRFSIDTQVIITNSQFSRFYGNKNYPVAHVIAPAPYNNKFDFSFTNCSFKNLMNSQNGIVGKIGRVWFTNCEFEHVYSDTANIQYIYDDPDKLLVYDNCSFQYDVQDRVEVRANLIDPQIVNKKFNKIPLIYFKNSANVIIRRSNFANYNYANTQGIIRLENNVTLQIEDTTFTNLSALSGALINSVGYNRISIQKSNIFYLTVYEGIINAKDYSEVIIKNSYFLNNFGYKSIVFSVLALSNIQISDSEISYNQALEQNSIGFIFNANKPIEFNNVIFKKNKAMNYDGTGEVGLGISLSQYSAAFQKCQFIDNDANTKTPNILVNRANKVIFEDCTFENLPSKQNTLYFGSFIHSVTSSNIFILNSRMSYGRAFVGGAIYALTYSQIVISGSIFTNNYATEKGGVIYGEGINDINITYSEFQSNQAKSHQGDTLYLLNSFSNGTLQNSKFFEYAPSNFLYAINFRGLMFSDCSFEIKSLNLHSDEANFEPSSNQLASIDLANTPYIAINKTTFQSLRGYGSNGGALSVKQTQNKNKDDTVKILNSQFLNCSSGLNGGAINFNDVGGIEISETVFIGNHAREAGGAIFFFCQNYGYDFEKCNIKIDATKFISNTADVQGGAIKWNVYQPRINNNSVKFINNKAKTYGDNIASVPQRLRRISKNDAQSSHSLRQLEILNEDKTLKLPLVDGVQSGGEIDLYFALVDMYNTIVSTDSSSKLFISVLQKGNKDQKDNTLSLESNNKIQCKNGIFEANQMVFVAWPNTTQCKFFSIQFGVEIQLVTDGIDYTIAENEIAARVYNNLSKTKSQVNNFTMDLKFRECMEGEQLLSSGKCKECPANTYLLTKQLSSMECKPCPQNDVAVCLGGKNIYPRPGFSRSSVYSDNFMECPNQEACLGQNSPENNPLGACQEGYRGILCSSCQVGYSKEEQSHTCQKCNSTDQTVLRLIGFIFLGILAIVALVYTSLINADGKKNFLPVFVRIMMNHLQLLVLTSQFELEWPKQLKQFFSIFGSISTVSTQFLSVDCLFDNRDSNNKDQQNNDQQLRGSTLDQFKWGMKRVYFFKVLLVSFLPFIVIIGSYWVWAFIYAAKHSRLNILKMKKKKVIQIRESEEKASSSKLNESAHQILIGGPQENLKHGDKEIERNGMKKEQHSKHIGNKKKKTSTTTNLKLQKQSELNLIKAEDISEQKSSNVQQKEDLEANQQQMMSIQQEKPSSLHDSGQKDGQFEKAKPQTKTSSLYENSQKNEAETKITMNSRVVQTIVIILFMIHPTIASYMLKSFNCDDIEGTKRLSQDLDILCFQGAHQTILYCIVLPSIALWGFGIPTLGMIIIFKNRNQLQSATVKSRFGFIYNGYKIPEGQYWEMFIMYRKIILIFIQVFLIQQGKLIQAMSTLVFVVVCLLINILKHPFTNLYLNMLETMSLVCSGISVYCGLYYISDIDSKKSSNLSLTEESKNFLFSMIVISHYIFASTWLYQFVQEVKSNVRQKTPKIYLAVCLCCRKQLLEHEHEVDKFNQRIAPFIADVDCCIDYFKKNIQLYQKWIIPEKEDILKDLITRYSTYIQGIERENQIKSKSSKIVEDQEDRMGIQIDEAVRETRFKKLIETEKQQRDIKKQSQKSSSSMSLNFIKKQSPRKQPQRHIKHHNRQYKTTLQLEVTKLPEHFSFSEERNNESDIHLNKRRFMEDHLKDIDETEEDKVETPKVRMVAGSNNNIGRMSQFYKQAQRNVEQLFYETSSDSQDNDNQNEKQGGFSYHHNFVNAKEHLYKKREEPTQRQAFIEDILSQSIKEDQSVEPNNDISPTAPQDKEFMNGIKIQHRKQNNQQHAKKRVSDKKLLFEKVSKGAISQKRKNDHLKQEQNIISKYRGAGNVPIELEDYDQCLKDSDDIGNDSRNQSSQRDESSLQLGQ